MDSQRRKRKKKRSSNPRFMEYNQHQEILLPPSIEDLIPGNHMVRTVNKVIEKMNIEALINTYKGGGRSSYDPLMLLKVLVYAYIMKIYSSRRISKGLREDINFMWLSGM
jgi:transposase